MKFSLINCLLFSWKDKIWFQHSKSILTEVRNDITSVDTWIHIDEKNNSIWPLYLSSIICLASGNRLAIDFASNSTNIGSSPFGVSALMKLVNTWKSCPSTSIFNMWGRLFDIVFVVPGIKIHLMITHEEDSMRCYQELCTHWPNLSIYLGQSNKPLSQSSNLA